MFRDTLRQRQGSPSEKGRRPFCAQKTFQSWRTATLITRFPKGGVQCHLKNATLSSRRTQCIYLLAVLTLADGCLVSLDYSSGFGGKYGVQADRVDKSAVGFDYQGKTEKHESQKGSFGWALSSFVDECALLCFSVCFLFLRSF